MTETASDKMNHVIQTILLLLAVILSATLCIQGIKLSELKERFDVNNRKVNYRTEEKTESSLFEQKLSQDDEEKYKKKIEKLEAQIADMQGWQDYLKETIYEHDRKAESLILIWRQTGTLSQADYYIDSIDGFFEENNYPPELKEKLIHLFNRKKNTIFTKVQDLIAFEPGKINGNLAELIQQGEQINSEYDEEIAKLLPKEEITLLKEYEQRALERAFIKTLQDMLGDDKFEKEEEKKLMTKMYNYRQSSRKKQEKKAQSYKINKEGPDEETMARLQKDNLEYNIKLYENYASLAEGILSESQMEVFEGILNMNKSSFINDSKNILSSDNEIGE